MKPYYQDAYCTIYHGDCREILPTLPKVDLVLTDPPYGIGRDGSKVSTGSHGGRKAYEFRGWDKSSPSEEVFKLIFTGGENQIIWGANYFCRHLPPTMGWLFWDKGQRICGSDGELAFTSYETALRVYTLNRVEIQTDGAVHPTQKPLRLISWCIAHADKHKTASTILDPFMGSGTTLRAAKDLGRKSIGIELEEKYCEIAARRLEQECLPLAELRPRAVTVQAGLDLEGQVSPSTESQATKDKAVAGLEQALWPEAKDIKALEGNFQLRGNWREHPPRSLNTVRVALEAAVNKYEELREVRADALVKAKFSPSSVSTRAPAQATNDQAGSQLTVGMLTAWAAELHKYRDAIAYHRRAEAELLRLIPKHETAEAL